MGKKRLAKVKSRKMPDGSEVYGDFPNSPQFLIPAEYTDRVIDLNFLAGAPEAKPPSNSSVHIYFRVGWNNAGDTSEHMADIEPKKREPTQADVLKALKAMRRCYCLSCRDGEVHNAENQQAVEAINLRARVAEANGIPTDGDPAHEAKIDKLLTVEASADL